MGDVNQSAVEEDAECGSARLAAKRYLQRGWSVIPVPFRSKRPVLKAWEQLRLTVDDVDEHFNGHLQNLGVLLGEPSGWLIDIDLDHARAVTLAPEYLPPTPAVFGRAGNPRSHYLYRVSRPAATRKFHSKTAGMLVEFRSTGMQTILPPSTHESGEPIEWESPDAEPATIDPDELLECVKRLADAVKIELGEKAARPAKKPKARPPKPAPDGDVADRRQERCLAAMLRIGLVDHNDGSLRLYACACRAVEHDLDDATALAVIREYHAERPFPKDWSDDEVLRRLRDAERKCERGEALKTDEDGCVPLGQRDPETDKLVLSPKRTLPTADAFIREFHGHPEGRTLHYYAGLLMTWCNNHFVEVEDEAVRKQLQAWLHDSLRYVYKPKSDESVLVPFESNPGTVKAALDSIRAYAHLPVTTTSPSWLRNRADDPPPQEILPCRTTLLHLPTMRTLPSTPAFFTVSALAFDPDPDAPLPLAWLAFLHQLFDGDLEALELLQEWFGYCLTGDTSLQKMLLIVGPKRSGKGTIARVLAHLVGILNVCGPTTSSLAGAFGLQPLIGKTLAIVSDARFSGENIATVVERLLCISGEDTLTIDRKFLGSVTMKLPTRFVFLSNEFPRLTDASGALAGRFMIIRLTQTFYGREDPQLTEKLLAELPSILNWSIEGWQRLKDRGHFVMPQSVAEVVREIEDLSSPVGAFVREECHVAPGVRINVDDLYGAWKRWCECEGRNAVSTKQTFGRDLAAAVAGISRRRGTAQQAFYEGITLKELLQWS